VIVLVTGGTGALGRHAVRHLVDLGAGVRVLSRGAAAGAAPFGVEWVRGDLTSRAQLARALRGVDAILHLATDPAQPGADIVQTQVLVTGARKAGIGRLVVPSIVGIDRIPFGYYRTKVAVEEVVRASGLRWMIVRSTQFHSLIDGYLAALASLHLPVLLPENLQFQTIDEAEVGERLAEATLSRAEGYDRPLAGPERLSLGVMAAAWKEIRRGRLMALPLAAPESTQSNSLWPAPLLEAYRVGATLPTGYFTAGRVTWREYLQRTSPAAVARRTRSGRRASSSASKSERIGERRKGTRSRSSPGPA
jgi:uncharacterized protein YbjT (DUF2867 family)